jgi:hypothetical protein
MPTPIQEIEMEIDGSFTIDQISNGLAEAEQLKNRKVTALSVLPDTPGGQHRSLAKLLKQPLGVPIPPVQILKASDPAPAGKTLQFKASIWVTNAKTDIAVYR